MNIKHLGSAVIGMGLLLAVSSAPCAVATPSSGPNEQAITIPLVAVPHGAKSGTAKPDIVIPGTCGVAFLYPSNGGSHVHYDFGYKDLNIVHYAVSAHIGASNLDNGEADAKSYSDASFGSTYEKQGNLYTGTGDNLVTAYIHAYGITTDCISSPNLHQDVYVY